MKPILICIAGGSASGKTTVVEEIKRAMGNDDVIFLKHDDYYRCQDHLTPEQRKLTNYDHPDALENDLLVEHLKLLLNNQDIDKPVYDFVSQTRKKETERYYKSISLDEIRQRVKDPDWWYATRAMCAFTLVVAEAIDAKYIVPTNIAMAYGIIDNEK